MSFLLIGNVTFISSFTVLTLGFALLYSVFNTRLCLSKDISSSPGGIGGSSKAFSLRFMVNNDSSTFS